MCVKKSIRRPNSIAKIALLNEKTTHMKEMVRQELTKFLDILYNNNTEENRETVCLN